MTWVLVIMLCANELPRERCNEETALWVMRPVMHYPQSIGCAIASMQMLPIMEDADDSTHPRIKCEAK